MTDYETDVNWPKQPRWVFDGATGLDCARVFGVDYAKVIEADGGELYLTRWGWPLLEHLRPRAWYDDRQYYTRGNRLPGGTGNVYLVPTKGRRNREVPLVVKFNRFAQEVPLWVSQTMPAYLTAEQLADARFNSPFEEFGLLRELRMGGFNPGSRRIYTKRALAVYCPPVQHSLRELGRSRFRFKPYYHQHELDQEPEKERHVALYEDRLYVTVFGYVPGVNAEELYDRGELTETDLQQLTARVTHELDARGFRVLDNKPKHFILRHHHRTGELLRRNGALAYALVDFELLERTEAYAQQLATA